MLKLVSIFGSVRYNWLSVNKVELLSVRNIFIHYWCLFDFGIKVVPRKLSSLKKDDGFF